MKLSLILILTLILIPVAFSVSLSQGESKTIENRVITIVSIQESKILVSVDGEKAIIGLNERETINGVEIIVTEIFYSDEASTVSLDTKLTYTCGDNICSSSESSETCCSDCGCSGNLKCSQNSCISSECTADLDCNDNNPLTDDSCSEYKCKHKEIKCKSNSECNDNNPDTEDLCSSGQCQNLPPICTKDEDCIDANPCTIEQCINNDCSYSPIENCREESKKEKTNEKIPSEINKSENENFIKRFFSWIKNIFS